VLEERQRRRRLWMRSGCRGGRWRWGTQGGGHRGRSRCRHLLEGFVRKGGIDGREGRDEPPVMRVMVLVLLVEDMVIGLGRWLPW
jgi:hypothetical protein